jgi:GR25 family glycosyltransferase involved in LPS biosynthesis
MKKISDIKHCFYINLESRTDRKQHVENQLKNIGINGVERFNAIKMENGAVGCSLSHLKCLENAKKLGWDHVLIVEDDITFLKPQTFIFQLNKFLKNHKSWDVVLFAGNNTPPYIPVDDTCVKVNKCQTTTGYLIKKHYYNTLIDNIREGLNFLLREPQKHRQFAIDKYWFLLQARDKWYLITPLTVVQREDYSDIEKKQTNYTHIMTDLDKKHLFNNTFLKHNFLQKINSFS